MGERKWRGKEEERERGEGTMLVEAASVALISCYCYASTLLLSVI